MPIEHLDYIKRVMDDYNLKVSSGVLPTGLAKPSPAEIRKQCRIVYQQRPNKKDDKILFAFFGPETLEKPLSQIIKGFDIDKFRPLCNYLKGVTETTDYRNIDLLAWLIDFQPRPYVLGMEDIVEAPSIPPEEPGNGMPGGATLEDPPKVPGDDLTISPPEPPEPPSIIPVFVTSTTSEKKPIKTAVLALLGVAAFVVLCYKVWHGQKTPLQLTGSNSIGCMYWTGTRYEPIPCNEYPKTGIKLPLDAEKMKSFERITREDTITENSIGKIYYIRMHGGIEYYTAGGTHPVEVTRYLQKLTPYMFYEHLYKGSAGMQVNDKPKYVSTK